MDAEAFISHTFVGGLTTAERVKLKLKVPVCIVFEGFVSLPCMLMELGTLNTILLNTIKNNRVGINLIKLFLFPKLNLFLIFNKSFLNFLYLLIISNPIDLHLANNNNIQQFKRN